jgi:hypothetical protein
MPGGFDYDVFLSHSHKDSQIVHPLAKRLREDGLDDWEIEPGDSIPQKIGDRLERSRVLLMLLSENFDNSDWTKYESGTFLFSDPQNKQQRFIPVRLDSAVVPFRIRHFARLEWQDRNEATYQKMLSACRVVSSDADQPSTVSLPVEKEPPARTEAPVPTAAPRRAAAHLRVPENLQNQRVQRSLLLILSGILARRIGQRCCFVGPIANGLKIFRRRSSLGEFE